MQGRKPKDATHVNAKLVHPKGVYSGPHRNPHVKLVERYLLPLATRWRGLIPYSIRFGHPLSYFDAVAYPKQRIESQSRTSHVLLDKVYMPETGNPCYQSLSPSRSRSWLPYSRANAKQPTPMSPPSTPWTLTPLPLCAHLPL